MRQLTDCVTTTVFLLAAATLETSSSVRPGSPSVVRSYPSLSQSEFKPTTTTATSASWASFAAYSISSSGWITGAPPILIPGFESIRISSSSPSAGPRTLTKWM